MKRITTAAFIMSLLVTLIPQNTAEAIPAFARKYKFTCTTCHSPFPRLKEYGEDFAGNGFEEKEEPTRYFYDTGDDNLLLQRELPVAIRLDAYGQVTKDEDETGSDLKSPYGLKLLSGGRVAKNIGYYFYFYVSERGKVAGIEDAYLHFNNLFGTELDIIVGQFQASDPLFKREMRLTYEDYMIYKTRPGYVKAGLTYDRGIMTTYGFSFGLDLVFELLNGNGISEADHHTRLFDSDNYKNIVGRASQTLGPVRFGVFAYIGKEGFQHNSSITNKTKIIGPDATISAGPMELNLQYLKRKDDNPFFNSFNPTEYETTGGLAEFIFSPKGDRSKYYITFLYNHYREMPSEYVYQTATVNYSYMLTTNLRILTEYTYDFELKRSRFILGFVAGI